MPRRQGWVSILQLDCHNASMQAVVKAKIDGDLNTISDLYGLGLYHKIASVQADSLQDALLLAQNSLDFTGIPWTRHIGVEANDKFKGLVRSTSIGDILVMEGQAFAVKPNGQEALPISPIHCHLA